MAPDGSLFSSGGWFVSSCFMVLRGFGYGVSGSEEIGGIKGGELGYAFVEGFLLLGVV